MTAVLRLRDVHRTHGTGEAAVRALAGVTLDVLAGELVAVMGPSGSGKSTLLNLAGGLDAPDSGEVLVEDVALSTLRRKELAGLRRYQELAAELGLVPQLVNGLALAGREAMARG